MKTKETLIWKCKHCQEEYPYEPQMCNDCGVVFIPNKTFEQVKPQTALVEEPQPYWQCFDCGHKHNNSLNYCEKCQSQDIGLKCGDGLVTLVKMYWNNLDIKEKHILLQKYFNGFTGTVTYQMEKEIWNKEVNSESKRQEDWQNSQVGYNSKPKMQYTQFSEELFIKYISKFSDEDKVKALEKLMRALDCKEAKLINDGFNLAFQYKQF